MKIGKEEEEVMRKDVESGRTDPEVFQWQIRYLFSILNLKNYRDCIIKVLKSYCARNPSIGYFQGLNYITAFLLIFLDENSAFWMLSFLIERWLFPNFHTGSPYSLNGYYI